MTVLSFQEAVKQFGQKAILRLDRVRRASIMELFSMVIDGTPVDTGMLRGNWQTTINAPAVGTTTRLDKAGDAAKAEALANLGSLLDVVYMTNGLPYAERIEYEGYSAQAPGGMVRVAVVAWPRIVEAKAKGIQ